MEYDTILSSCGTMILRKLIISLSQLLSNKPTIVWSVCLVIKPTKVYARVGYSDPFTKYCIKVIHEALGKSNTYRVDQLILKKFTFSVYETIGYREGRPIRMFKVYLHACVCDYGKFQVLHMPCSYVITMCSNFHHDYQTLILAVLKKGVYTPSTT